jgi:phosphoadenosine phosphosulfate reductase
MADQNQGVAVKQAPEFTPEELQRLSDGFEEKPAQEVLRWALERFQPNVALACSFGAEDVALVDMVSKIDPSTKVFYLDTEALFPETYELIERVVKRYKVQPLRAAAAITLADQARLYGDELWQRQPNLCCDIRKVQPLTAVLSPLRAWVTGIRREQAPTRANAGIVEWDGKFGLVKVNPLARWTHADVWRYIVENEAPYNPLHDRGYPSIGCTHCTRPVKSGEDPRAGRWAGSDKTECGLHQ